MACPSPKLFQLYEKWLVDLGILLTSVITMFKTQRVVERPDESPTRPNPIGINQHYQQWRTRRGGRPHPWLENFRANSVFRASSSCSKILKDKKYFNAVKNFRVNSVLQGKRRLFKILNETNIYSIQ